MDGEVEETIDDEPLSLDKSLFEDRIDQALYNSNVYILHGEILPWGCKTTSKVLESMSLKAIKSNPVPSIRIILNSVGGNLYDGLLIFDTIQSARRRGVEVIVEVRGLAASMAAVILQAGTKRVSSKHTRFLLHEVSDLAIGTATQVQEQAVELKKVNQMIAEILAERTGRALTEIEDKLRNKDFWLSATEALSFGLIDEVV